MDSSVGRAASSCILCTVEDLAAEIITASRKLCLIEPGIGKFEAVAPRLPSLEVLPFTHLLMRCFFRLLLEDDGRLGPILDAEMDPHPL